MSTNYGIDQYDIYKQRISDYFMDIMTYYEQNRYSMSVRFDTHHMTITRLVEGVGHQIQLNTITSIAAQLNVSPIDILQYKRDRDFDRLVIKCNYIKNK